MRFAHRRTGAFALALTLFAAGDLAGQAAPAPYVASSRGEVYYWTGASCSAWQRLSPRNLRGFDSREAAEAAGYRASASRGCAGPASETAAVERDAHCVVQRVVDGDTVVCGGESIRLLLIDAPEDRQADLGLRARLALEELVPRGTPVRLEFDVERRDRYGRLLAHLRRGDGVWVNHAMVRGGYAVVLVYPPNVRGVEVLREAAVAARDESAGLWAEGGFECEPREFRRGRCG